MDTKGPGDGLDRFGGAECAYMTVVQVARYFGLSRPYVYKLLDVKAVPSVQFGGTKRVGKTIVRQIEASGGLDGFLAAHPAGGADE